MNFLPGWMPAATRAIRFPVVEATNTSSTNSSVSSHTVNLPSGITAGDLLIIVFGQIGGTVTITGYTQLATQSFTNGRLTLFYKTATGSEGSTVTATTSGNTQTAENSYRISGWLGTPEATTTSGSGASADPPSLTPSWGLTKTLWLAAAAGTITGSNSLTVSTFPSGYTNGIQASSAIPVTPGTVTGSARLNSEAASENPGTFTLSNAGATWGTATIGIRPN